MNLSALNLLADFGPEMAAVVVPLGIFMIPIVAILTKHQQKMAELMHHGGQDNQLIANLQREVYELRQMVIQHAVALDDIGMGRGSLPPTNPPASPPPPPGMPGGGW